MRMTRIILILAVPCLALAKAEDPPKEGKAEKSELYEFRRDHDPDGIGKFYMGREIARVMGHQGAGWLERPERVDEENPAKLIDALGLKPEMVVADIGAGSGYHTFLMAPKVGPKGKVLAVDIQPEMLAIIRAKAKRQKVENVELVRGTIEDPKLPKAGVDLILLVDVYHELSHPYEMTRRMIESLKPEGRLVLVEFRLEDPKVPIKLLHKMSERQVLKEMEQFPDIEHDKTVNTLPWQHIIIFRKAGEVPEAIPKK